VRSLLKYRQDKYFAVVGVTLGDRAFVPDDALITTQTQADKLQRVRC